jgi:hypothetical protein
MPTVSRFGPYRLYFFSDEGHEPPHVHVERDGARAKFWLNPVGVACSRGFPAHELARVRRLVMVRATDLRRRWDEHFRR